MGIFRIETSGNITPTSQVAEKMNRDRQSQNIFLTLMIFS